jgi:hypothetical protein
LSLFNIISILVCPISLHGEITLIVGIASCYGSINHGFGSFAGDELVEGGVVFAKLEAPTKGAEFARKAAQCSCTVCMVPGTAGRFGSRHPIAQT